MENIFHDLKLGFTTVLVKDSQVKAIETKKQGNSLLEINYLCSIGKETVSIPETAVTPETSHKNCRERNLVGGLKRCHETSSVKQDCCSVSFRWLFSNFSYTMYLLVLKIQLRAIFQETCRMSLNK